MRSKCASNCSSIHLFSWPLAYKIMVSCSRETIADRLYWWLISEKSLFITRLIATCAFLKSLINKANPSVHYIYLMMLKKPLSSDRSTKRALTHARVFLSFVSSISLRIDRTKSRFYISCRAFSSIGRKQRRLIHAFKQSALSGCTTKPMRI